MRLVVWHFSLGLCWWFLGLLGPSHAHALALPPKNAVPTLAPPAEFAFALGEQTKVSLGSLLFGAKQMEDPSNVGFHRILVRSFRKLAGNFFRQVAFVQRVRHIRVTDVDDRL